MQQIDSFRQSLWAQVQLILFKIRAPSVLGIFNQRSDTLSWLKRTSEIICIPFSMEEEAKTSHFEVLAVEALDSIKAHSLQILIEELENKHDFVPLCSLIKRGSVFFPAMGPVLSNDGFEGLLLFVKKNNFTSYYVNCYPWVIQTQSLLQKSVETQFYLPDENTLKQENYLLKKLKEHTKKTKFLTTLYKDFENRILEQLKNLKSSPSLHQETSEHIAYHIRQLSTLFEYTSITGHRFPVFIYTGFLGHKLWRYWQRFMNLISPKLGKLHIYPAKTLILPLHYQAPPDLSCAPLPSITIVTPSYNQGHFIERTVKSVLDQNYPHLELIIQDGGSTDNTLEVLSPYQSRLHHVESRPDKGQSQAINLGFQRGTGEIMAYLNSDDLLLPGALHYVADYFQKHPKVDVVYGHRILIDEDDKDIGRWVLPTHNNDVLSWADYIPQETLFWRRRIWDKSGGQIDESFRFAMDWDLLLRFREKNAKFKRLPRFLGAFRVHSQQKTSAQGQTLGLEEMKRLRQRTLHREVNHLEVKKNIRKYLLMHLITYRLYRFGLLKY